MIKSPRVNYGGENRKSTIYLKTGVACLGRNEKIKIDIHWQMSFYLSESKGMHSDKKNSNFIYRLINFTLSVRTQIVR